MSQKALHLTEAVRLYQAKADATDVPPEYKRTEVGVIPKAWEDIEIGDLKPFVTSGSRGWARFYAEVGASFLRIGNLSRGSIYLDLADLKYVRLPRDASAEAIRTEVRDGDVLVSITADIGIVGWVSTRVEKPAYINQHIALVRIDRPSTSSRFVAYYLASDGPQRLFVASTDVGAKKGMNLATIRRIRLALPPPEEQHGIAEALSAVDGLLEALEALIAKKRAIKQGAMQQLLTGVTRLPTFRGNWGLQRLGDLLAHERPDRYIVQSTEYSEVGDIPVLTANKSFILGYTTEAFGLCEDLPAIIFDDFTTDSKLAASPFKVKSSAIKLLRPKHDQVSLHFVFERMQLIRFPVGDHKRYYLSEYQNIELPFPGFDEQLAIVSILSHMDAEIAALEARRDKTRAIKQGMMQQLLTGRVRLVEPQQAKEAPC
jgi:type I restriction enzyme S subunit